MNRTLCVLLLFCLTISTSGAAFAQPSKNTQAAKSSSDKSLAPSTDQKTQDKTQPPPEPYAATYRFQHLDYPREAAEALQELFPNIQIVAAGTKDIILVGSLDQKKEVDNAVEVLKKLDLDILNHGDWVANHVLRLKSGSAKKIAESTATTKLQGQGESEFFKVEAVGDNILIIVPLPNKDPNNPFPIELEKEIISLKEDLREIDAKLSLTGGARESLKEKEKAESPPSPAEHPPTPTEQVSDIVRLYHLRSAQAIATAFTGSGAGQPNVKSIGEDLLLITAKDKKTADGVKRLVAILDLPRPQISLQIWSVQMSYKKQEEAEDNAMRVHSAVITANEVLTNALARASFTLGERVREQQKERKNSDRERWSPSVRSADYFVNYLTKEFKDCGREDEYCLGYTDALVPSRPSLSKILVYLAADEDPKAAVSIFIKEMENDPEAKTAAPALKLDQFKGELERLMGQQEELRIFRAALLDFLFQYKWMYQYPEAFIPYDVQRTAHQFDGIIAPLFDAIRADLELLVQRMEKDWPTKAKKSSDTGLYSGGLIKVSTLSGTEAKVTGKTASYFDVTPPMSLKDLLADNEVTKNILPGTPPSPEKLLTTIAANVLTRQSVLAEISRGVELTIKPTALETASSAELDVNLKAGEGTAAPTVVSGKANEKDPLDRVAQHEVQDRVRVESMKLFEVSTFSMLVQHPQQDYIIPVVGDAWHAVFGTVPGVGRLFSWRRPPAERNHRSIAIVSAVVLPTAMDIALSIRFKLDREINAHGTVMFKNVGELPAPVRQFHQKKIRCILEPEGSGCQQLQLSKIVGDQP